MEGSTDETQTEVDEIIMDDKYQTHFDWFRLTLVVMTSLLIFTIGMLGNVTTIYIYTRSKKLRRNKVFELILAGIDIYALLVPLGILSYDVYKDRKGFSSLYVTCASPASHGYYITILFSTIWR